MAVQRLCKYLSYVEPVVREGRIQLESLDCMSLHQHSGETASAYGNALEPRCILIVVHAQALRFHPKIFYSTYPCE